MVRINAVVCKQPIGSLYLFSMKASDLKDLITVECRQDGEFNVQRKRNNARVKLIQKYSNTVDACFPLSVLINIDETDVSIIGNTLDINVKPGVFKILDGQHRVFGILNADFDYDVPIGAFIGLSNRQKARVFKAINFNAKPVNKSHVYDLISQTEDGSVGEQTAHQVTKLLNTDSESPFKDKIKMLGVGKGWFNQASLVKSLAGIIDKGCLLNVSGEDVYVVVRDYFKAWYHVFPEEFLRKDSLLVKNFGVQVMLDCFEPLYNACHKPDGNDFSRFKEVVSQFRSVAWTKESVDSNTSASGVNKRVNELLQMV
jgi:DGQHR domain-containing protein